MTKRSDPSFSGTRNSNIEPRAPDSRNSEPQTPVLRHCETLSPVDSSSLARLPSHGRVLGDVASGRHGHLAGELAEACGSGSGARSWGQGGRERSRLGLLKRQRGLIRHFQLLQLFLCQISGEQALDQLQLLLFFIQEDVHQKSLLFLQLLADVFGHVRDHPGHQHAHGYHQVLEKWERHKYIHIYTRMLISGAQKIIHMAGMKTYIFPFNRWRIFYRPGSISGIGPLDIYTYTS